MITKNFVFILIRMRIRNYCFLFYAYNNNNKKFSFYSSKYKYTQQYIVMCVKKKFPKKNHRQKRIAVGRLDETGVLEKAAVAASLWAICFSTIGICSNRARTSSGNASWAVYRIGTPSPRNMKPPPCSFGNTDN